MYLPPSSHWFNTTNVAPATFPTRSSWKKGAEALLHLVTQGSRLTEAPPSFDTAISICDLKVCCSSRRKGGEFTGALFLLIAYWPDYLHGPRLTTWEPGKSSHTLRKGGEPALMRARNLYCRLLGGPFKDTLQYRGPIWNEGCFIINIVTGTLFSFV